MLAPVVLATMAMYPAGGAAATRDAAATVALSPCDLRGSAGQGRVAAECGRLNVPENPDKPDGARLDLFVARIPALTPDPAADAVTIINGGPGASSVSLYVDIEPAFAGLHREHDIVVVDQRGTGRSAPLECPALEAASQTFDAEVIRQSTRACLDGLTQDPRYYTTSVAVGDLEAVRRALGYSQWNVYGVSYGTRVAQHYLQRYPDAVRTLILDGVVPLGHHLGPDIALNAERALESILARCAAADYCAGAFPDLHGELSRLGDRLKDGEIQISVAHPVTGREVPLDLGYAHLAMALRLLSYAPETSALIPLIITEAQSRANYVPLATQAVRIEEELTSAISFGMHNSVVCTEDTPYYGDLESLMPELEASYLGADQVRALETICEVWPAGVRDAGFDAPRTSEKPVLLLSGEFDPITPPEYGALAARTFPNGLHLIAPGQGHGVVARGCVPQLIDDFVAAAATDDLDTVCIERLAGDDFFVDLLGPPP